MDFDDELEKYYQDLKNRVCNEAAAEGQATFYEDVFTENYIDKLSSVKELENAAVSYYLKNGKKINAAVIPEDLSLNDVTLIVTIYKNNPSLFSVPPSEAKRMLERAKQFFLESAIGLQKFIDDSTEAFDVARFIYENHSDISVVNLVLFCNGTIKSIDLDDETVDGVTFKKSIWDIERVFRLEPSGYERETINFNLKEIAGQNLVSIKIEMPESTQKRIKGDNKGEDFESGGYTTYLTAIPGNVLFNIYDKYGSALLEKNVRSFLQLKGKINQGIRDTIRESPENFLAYNNGISATAENVKTINSAGNVCILTEIRDFQIVNGGQTTASIYYTHKKYGVPLDNVYVQTKITVVTDPGRLNSFVPYISKYANTQNKIQGADLYSNNEFSQAIEKLSRSVWAPSRTGGAKQTKWFYERARGQYVDMRMRAKSVSRFDEEYPKEQYFDKLILARCENLWEQLPYIASKGGQTSFSAFIERLQANPDAYKPDLNYFKTLVAKVILFREIRKIVRSQGFRGFWANISDYTYSYLSYRTEQKLDLSLIWARQTLSESLTDTIKEIAISVHNYIFDSANGQNISQWCKKEACWRGLIAQVKLPVMAVKRSTKSRLQAPISKSGVNDFLCTLDGSLWRSIAKWGHETGLLAYQQRGTARGIAIRVEKGEDLSELQVKSGFQILKTAIERGFITDSEVISKVENLTSQL